MGNAFLYGNGSDGIKLNYNVICSTTQPTDPKNGTIWIKSSIQQGSVYLKNKSTPSGSTDGNIVIQFEAGAGSDSNNCISIFAYKKNGKEHRMRVRFLTAWQYYSSMWNSMDAYIYNAGSWYQFSSKFTATINVTYPAGSTCTATDSTTFLTAPDTSGSWACVVPNAGTWTVSCTDNSYSASNNVTISTDGQIASITLQYRKYLFQYGTGAVVNFTKKNSSNGSVSINTKTITLSFSGTSSGEASALTTGKINLTNYKTLYFDMSVDKIDSRDKYGRRFGVFSATADTSNIGSTNNVACIFPTSKASRKEYSIDVSSVNTSYYIGTKGIGGATIYNIWLE